MHYPSEEELKLIREWPYTDFLGLAELVKRIWSYNDWGRLSDRQTDDLGHEYKELRLATMGWSGNEDIVCALDENVEFHRICRRSSRSGSLYIYHIPKPQPV